jgi:hypothetical protein
MGSIFSRWASVKTNRFIHSLNHVHAKTRILSPTEPIARSNKEPESFAKRGRLWQVAGTDHHRAAGRFLSSWQLTLKRLDRHQFAGIRDHSQTLFTHTVPDIRPPAGRLRAASCASTPARAGSRNYRPECASCSTPQTATMRVRTRRPGSGRTPASPLASAA